MRTAINLYLRARRPTLGARSLTETRYVLERFQTHLGPATAIRALRRRHIEEWLSSRDVAPNTLRHELSVVRTFTTWCVDHQLLEADPCTAIRHGRLPQPAPREIRDTREIVRLFDELPDERAVVVVSLMVLEGLRVAEVAGIQVPDIDVGERIALVHGKGNKERWVPLHPETIDAIQHYLSIHPAAAGPLVRSYTHPGPITSSYLSSLVSRWMRAAGIKARPGDGRSSHALRHTALGALLDSGADIREVQAIAGHATLGSTYRYLARRQAQGQLREAMDRREGYRDAKKRPPPEGESR